jgi:hypothetical protein
LFWCTRTRAIRRRQQKSSSAYPVGEAVLSFFSGKVCNMYPHFYIFFETRPPSPREPSFILKATRVFSSNRTHTSPTSFSTRRRTTTSSLVHQKGGLKSTLLQGENTSPESTTPSTSSNRLQTDTSPSRHHLLLERFQHVLELQHHHGDGITFVATSLLRASNDFHCIIKETTL